VIGLILYPLRGWIAPLAVATILICKGTSQPAVIGVLAGEHHLDDEAAASIIGLTTICSIITLPVLSGLVKTIFYKAIQPCLHRFSLGVIGNDQRHQ